jgi:hypothetical protein
MTRPWLWWLAFDAHLRPSLQEMVARERAVKEGRRQQSERCWQAALPLYHEEPS